MYGGVSKFNNVLRLSMHVFIFLSHLLKLSQFPIGLFLKYLSCLVEELFPQDFADTVLFNLQFSLDF